MESMLERVNADEVLAAVPFRADEANWFDTAAPTMSTAELGAALGIMAANSAVGVAMTVAGRT
jgi:hypothetical protein